MNENDKITDFMNYAHSNAQNMVSLTDSKANITLTIQSLFLSIGLGSTILSEFSNHNLLFHIIFISFCGVSIIGIIFSILVYKARTFLSDSENRRKGLLYPGHIVKFPNSDSYYQEIKEINSDKMIEEYSKQVYQISKIIALKTKYLKYSISFLLINIAIFTGLMLSILLMYNQGG